MNERIWEIRFWFNGPILRLKECFHKNEKKNGLISLTFHLCFTDSIFILCALKESNFNPCHHAHGPRFAIGSGWFLTDWVSTVSRVGANWEIRARGWSAFRLSAKRLGFIISLRAPLPFMLDLVYHPLWISWTVVASPSRALSTWDNNNNKEELEDGWMDQHPRFVSTVVQIDFVGQLETGPELKGRVLSWMWMDFTTIPPFQTVCQLPLTPAAVDVHSSVSQPCSRGVVVVVYVDGWVAKPRWPFERICYHRVGVKSAIQKWSQDSLLPFVLLILWLAGWTSAVVALAGVEQGMTRMSPTTLLSFPMFYWIGGILYTYRYINICRRWI